ncbi:MAG: invasion associated locus B family protein [Rhizomicrobium sp.]
MKHSLFTGLLVAAVALSASALADTPKVLGTYSSWTALTVGTGDSKTCYIIARPQSSLPAKAKRDAIGFLVTDWPARKAKAEPQAVPGYAYKDGSTVTAQVGSDKFDFFTKNDNDNGDGDAWIKSAADEARLVSAMRSGQTMIVTGISKRGTMTHDTYSLAGVSDALDKIHAECGM